MDSDIEIVENDIFYDPEFKDVLTDFSQVKIEVHGRDVAEKILEDLADHTEEYDENDIEVLEYPTADADDGTQEILQDSEQNHGDYVEAVPEEYAESQDQEHTNFSNVPIKEEIEQFDGTDYTDFDEAPAEAYNDDLPPEDIYHFNNKIILGSKPCNGVSVQQNATHDVEESFHIHDIYEIEEDNLDAVVVLENWGLQLQKSLSFCKKCGTLFPTPNHLDAHNMSVHSFLVPVNRNVAVKSTAKPAFARKSTSALLVKGNKNIARKSTGSNSILTSKFCNHCNMVFHDHTALIKHLYELLPLKQLKCNTCDAVFNSQKELTDHNIVHVKSEKPKVKKERTVKEVTDFKKKLLYEEDLKKKRPISPKKEVKIIPLSVLFQCPLCSTHFLTAFAGLQHWLVCRTGSSGKKPTNCNICKRKLRKVDIDMHKKQHEICTKFKVYKITNNILERTLCKCPKCELHFKDLTINHLKRCGKISAGHCQKCNILIHRSKVQPHSRVHTQHNLKPKDFIIVQYSLQNKAVKRKLEPMITPSKKIKLEFPNIKIKKEPLVTDKNLQKITTIKIKKEPLDTSINASTSEKKEVGKRIKMVNRLKFEKGNKVRMYFCKNCNGCCRNDSNRAIHMSKQCKRRSKVIDRIICPECGLQFNRKTILSHENMHKKRSLTIHDIVFYHIGTLRPIVPSIPDYPQCNNCKITFFSSKVQGEHICGEDYETCNVCGEKFHNSAYSIHMEFHKLIKTVEPKKLQAKMIPELMQKYQSFNLMWNILYSCSKCEIITDLYDRAIQHSQGHLNHETFNSSKNIKCYICNLKFDETSWSKHTELHSRMRINNKDFKILKYDPRKLLTEEWFQLFDIIPEQQIKQITDLSLYGYERSVKMQLVKDGRAEFTLYCCSRCKVCYANNEIQNHMKSTCKKPANWCKFCNISFSDIHALTCHELMHLKGIEKDEFRVVSFTKIEVNNITLESGNSMTAFELYKCRICGACLQKRQNIQKHKCIPETRKRKCDKCKQYFNSCNVERHKEEHRKHPEFNLKNLKVHFYDPPNVKGDGTFKRVKRKYKRRNKDEPSKPAKTTKTATAKTPKVYKADTSETAKGETKSAKVYKCDCGLHYTSTKTIEKHIQKCCPDIEISTQNCSKCGLLFPTDILVSHLCKHHSKNTKIVIEPFKKSEESEQSLESVESTSENIVQARRKTATFTKETANSLSQRYKVKLYKCSECNIYFVVQNTCYKHVRTAHKPVDPKQYIECKLCGLQFTLKTLPLHISRHHQNEFSLDSVLVEEYHPPLGKGPPKIDLYIAAEKVQSLQVTSSIEEGRISNS